jgi:hypothetical protein
LRERSLDSIDAHDSPGVLSEIDRLRAGAAAYIERTARRERSWTLDQRGQLSRT